MVYRCMSSPSNSHPSQAAMPDRHCSPDRSDNRVTSCRVALVAAVVGAGEVGTMTGDSGGFMVRSSRRESNAGGPFEDQARVVVNPPRIVAFAGARQLRPTSA